MLSAKAFDQQFSETALKAAEKHIDPRRTWTCRRGDEDDQLVGGTPVTL